MEIDTLFLQCSCLRNLRLIIGFKQVDLSHFRTVLSGYLGPPRASRYCCPSLIGSFCEVIQEELCSIGEANSTPPVTFLSFFAFFRFGSCCCGCCCSCGCCCICWFHESFFCECRPPVFGDRFLVVSLVHCVS